MNRDEKSKCIGLLNKCIKKIKDMKPKNDKIKLKKISIIKKLEVIKKII